MTSRITALAALSIYSFLPSASAETAHTIDMTVDLQGAQYFHNPANPTGVAQIYPFLQSLDMRVGDTVDMTVRFIPGQTLTMQSNGGQQFFSGWLHGDTDLSPPNGSNFTITNATLNLFDSNTNTVLEFSRASETTGSAHIGPLFIGSYLPQGSTVSFSGYRTTYEVAALQGGQYFYEGIFLQFANLDGGRLWLTTSPIPEPSSSALIFAGLIAGAFFVRAKQA